MPRSLATAPLCTAAALIALAPLSAQAKELDGPLDAHTTPYRSDKVGDLRMWGMDAEPQSAERPYSITTAADVIRFEARTGDRRQKASEKTKLIERSEISFPKNPLRFKELYRVKFEVLFEAGAPAQARADKFFQVHNVNDPQDGSLGPVFALQLDKDIMRVVARADANRITKDRVEDRWLYQDSHPVQRDHWYKIQIDVKIDPSGNGFLTVARDGRELVKYRGPLGYNDAQPPYAKLGIYRDTSADTQVRGFRKLSIAKVAD